MTYRVGLIRVKVLGLGYHITFVNNVAPYSVSSVVVLLGPGPLLLWFMNHFLAFCATLSSTPKNLSEKISTDEKPKLDVDSRQNELGHWGFICLGKSKFYTFSLLFPCRIVELQSLKSTEST